MTDTEVQPDTSAGKSADSAKADAGKSADADAEKGRGSAKARAKAAGVKGLKLADPRAAWQLGGRIADRGDDWAKRLGAGGVTRGAVRTVGRAIPFAGSAVALWNIRENWQQGDWIGVGLNALSAIPVVGIPFALLSVGW